MTRWFVDIGGVSDATLAVLGYIVIAEDDDMTIYRYYDGDIHIVSKTGRRYLYVSDINDAITLNSKRAIEAPD